MAAIMVELPLQESPSVNNLYTSRTALSTNHLRKTYVEFREAMDRVGISAVDLAAEFQSHGIDVKPQTLRQARMDPASDGYRSPPPGWREVLADLARERLPELQAVVEELEGTGEEG